MRFLLVVYDNASYIHEFPLGLAYIAEALHQAGIEVQVYNQDMHHYPDEHLTRFLDQNPFDALGISITGGYYQYRKLLALSEAINRSKQRPFFVIGGHGPAPEPEFFLGKTQADVVITGEGELTVVELVDALARKRPLSGVPGIAYREGARVKVNPRRPLIEDLDSIAWPAYRLFPMEYYRLLRMPHASNSDLVMRLLTGRGCTFRCNFCYRMDEGLRTRSVEAITEEMLFLNRDYGINYFAFADELLMSSTARAEELCRGFLGTGMQMKWECNGRLNYARPDLLRLMKQSGCVFINYGIEAMDDQILRNMNKALNTRQIIQGVEATLEAGISPGLNIIFGNIGESLETLEKGVDFLLKYSDGSQLRTIRPVTPYPGSPLYHLAIEQGRLKDCQDFYENKHVNSDLLSVNFTELNDEEFHRALLEANSRLIADHFGKKAQAVLGQAKTLYQKRDAGFRGFRQT